MTKSPVELAVEALKPFADAADNIATSIEGFKVVAVVPGGEHARAFANMQKLLTAENFRRAADIFHALAALQPLPLRQEGEERERIARLIAEAIGEAIVDGWPLYVEAGYESAYAYADHNWQDTLSKADAILSVLPAKRADHDGERSAGWRPEVRAFANLMEAQLRANDHKPGWKNDTDLGLFERLGEESADLLSALHRHAKRLSWGDGWVMEDTVPRIGREAADVANFAMMIADVCGALPQAPDPSGPELDR